MRENINDTDIGEIFFGVKNASNFSVFFIGGVIDVNRVDRFADNKTGDAVDIGFNP